MTRSETKRPRKRVNWGQSGRDDVGRGARSSAGCELHDACELVWIETRTANQRAVDVGLRHQLFGGRRLHRAAVLDADSRGSVGVVAGRNGTADRLAELPRGDGDVRYQLCIDFCASEALFERHRGTKNSWRKVKDNIERLLADDSQAHIALQVTDISSFEVIASDAHPDGLAALRAMLPPESERLSVSGRIFHNATGHVEGIRERKQATGSKYNLCPYPWTSMVIASNGDVVACCRDLQHKTVLGNLFEQELPEIWHGEPYQALRRALADEQPGRMDACRNCDLPYDAGKFTFSHLVRTGVQRLGIFR